MNDFNINEICNRCSDIVSDMDSTVRNSNISVITRNSIENLNALKRLITQFCKTNHDKISRIFDYISDDDEESEIEIRSIQYGRDNYMEYVDGIKDVLSNGITKTIDIEKFIKNDSEFISKLYGDELNGKCLVDKLELNHELEMLTTHNDDIDTLSELVKKAYDRCLLYHNLDPIVRLCAISTVKYSATTLREIIKLYDSVYKSIVNCPDPEKKFIVDDEPIDMPKYKVILPIEVGDFQSQ